MFIYNGRMMGTTTDLSCVYTFFFTQLWKYILFLFKENPLLSCDTFNNLFLTTVLWAKGSPGIFGMGAREQVEGL